jgi:hypothetical protein
MIRKLKKIILQCELFPPLNAFWGKKMDLKQKVQINLLMNNMVLHFSLRMCRAIPSLMSSSHCAEIGQGTALHLTNLNSMKYIIPKVLTAGTIKNHCLLGYANMSFGKQLPTFLWMYCLHLQNFSIIREQKKCPSQIDYAEPADTKGNSTSSPFLYQFICSNFGLFNSVF